MTIKFSVLVAALLVAAPATAGSVPVCGAVSDRVVKVCDAAGACISVSPRTVCRAASATRPVPRRVEIADVSMEEQGRRQLDRLIAALR